MGGVNSLKKYFLVVGAFLILLTIIACQTELEERMVLLDEKISRINISTSTGIGNMNEEVILTIKDKKSIKMIEKAITTAVKELRKVENLQPDYDIMVEYEGAFPTHGIHLWLGNENKESIFAYITFNSYYVTSPKMTNELRKIILSE